MSCLEKINKILSAKKGYKKLLERINQKDFSGIETKNGGFMMKFIKSEEDKEIYIGDDMLNFGNKDEVIDLLDGKIDLSQYKAIDFVLVELHKVQGIEERIEELFTKLTIKSINFGWTELHQISGIEEHIEKLFTNPSIKSISFGRTELHQISGIEEHIEKLFTNPSIRSINFGATKLEEIEGIEDKIGKLFINPNIESIYFGLTKLQEIPLIESNVEKLFTNPNIKRVRFALFVLKGGLLEILEKYLSEKAKKLLKYKMGEDLEQIRERVFS